MSVDNQQQTLLIVHKRKMAGLRLDLYLCTVMFQRVWGYGEVFK